MDASAFRKDGDLKCTGNHEAKLSSNYLSFTSVYISENIKEAQYMLSYLLVFFPGIFKMLSPVHYTQLHQMIFYEKKC